MKIATLQFDPTFGEVELSIRSADSILLKAENEGDLQGIELLVLPELAFTGYNHPSREAIEPYLEPTAGGPSTQWAIRTAKRLKTTVAVGYPELSTSVKSEDARGNDRHKRERPDGGGNVVEFDYGQRRIAYNSFVLVDAEGTVIAHYRKHHLYYTDEPWAEEGPERFVTCELPLGANSRHQQHVKAAFGICMDINPRRFEAPWTAFEFSTHAVQSQAKIVVVSMAWLTRLTRLELEVAADKPDLDTFSYWLERFRPLLRSEPNEALPETMTYTNGADNSDEVIVVLANRIGDEGLGRIIGEVQYAGSSCVVGMRKTGEVRIWNILGRATPGLCIADTNDRPKYTLKMSPSTSSQG